MEQLPITRLRLEEFPSRSHYCIEHKVLTDSYVLHQHDFFEIEIILQGSGEHYLNGNRYHLSRGSAYFLNLNDFHEVVVQEPIEILTFMFSDHWITDALLYRFLANEKDIICYVDENTLGTFLAISDMIQKEYDSVDPFKQVSLRDLTEYLMVSILRCTDVDISNVKVDIENPVESVLLYLSAHFRDTPSLADMAALVSHNTNYFSELFHKYTGKSYVQYLTDLKINHAKKLLVSTDASILDISLASGFHSYSNFSHIFREMHGYSALEYRKQHKNLLQ